MMKRLVLIFAVLVCTVTTFGVESAIGQTDCGKELQVRLERDLATPTRVDGSLTTLFAQNNGFAGNTFDIEPLWSYPDMYITGIDINWTVAGETVNCDLYYKNGTSVGFETDPGVWTMLASGSGTAAGPDLTTFIDFTCNGIALQQGQVYGIYVDIPNYTSLTGYLGYTNGAPTLFSNADLELTTNSGHGSPAFSIQFPDRKWNGTIFYADTCNPGPFVDTRVNGEDDNVVIPVCHPVVIDLKLRAGSWVGVYTDVWCVGSQMWTGGGHFTYGRHNSGPSWGAGWCLPSKVFISGTVPLYTIANGNFESHTIAPWTLAPGAYKIRFGLEKLGGGGGAIPDDLYNGPLSIETYDTCNFTIVPPPPDYRWDDGSTENLLAYTSGGDIVGMHRFETICVGQNITEVGSIFGCPIFPNYSPGPGTQIEFFIWEDPTPDMIPGADLNCIHAQICTIQTVDGDTHDWYPVSGGPVTVTTDHFWVGFRIPHNAGEYCLSIDSSSPYAPGSAFVTGCIGAQWGFDPYDLDAASNVFPPVESQYGFWTVRAKY